LPLHLPPTAKLKLKAGDAVGVAATRLGEGLHTQAEDTASKLVNQAGWSAPAAGLLAGWAVAAEFIGLVAICFLSCLLFCRCACGYRWRRSRGYQSVTNAPPSPLAFPLQAGAPPDWSDDYEDGEDSWDDGEGADGSLLQWAETGKCEEDESPLAAELGDLKAQLEAQMTRVTAGEDDVKAAKADEMMVMRF
jgi:hypothetical protein